ncbi:MAG: hypothetical protein LBP33_11060 [Candidatus Adiutrix sp.]|jgi:hypothetical protein|nr:hypothetical protein [Candidatus Adiutrix sp.]
MSKPIISVVGTLGNYSSNIPTLSKILWSNSTFIADEYLDANSSPAMPISSASNAPYVFSFLDEAASQPQFRVSLSNYSYTLGATGSSTYWVYDPTGTGWSLQGQPSPMNPPYNPYGFANITYSSTPYLVVGDYDSANNNGGTLCLVSMSGTGSYGTVASIGIANQTSGTYTYQAHVQDVYVAGSRIFALVIYSNILSTAPANLQYISSEVREYKLITDANGNVAFDPVGSAVSISKNAVCLVPYSSGSNNYLFIPCIGGMQNYGPPNNGADSSLSLVELTTTGIGPEAKPYIGGAASTLHDFRGMAIASDGTAYILTGDYAANTSMSWSLYKDNAATLIGKASGTIPLSFRIQSDVNTSAYFWALGICQGGADEYLAFAKGSVNNPSAYVAYDELHLLKVGQTWSPTNDANNVIIPSNSTTGGTAGLTQATANGFAINSMDISVPGGVPTPPTPLRSAAPPARAAIHRSHAAMAAEVREKEKKIVEALLGLG